MSNKQALLDRVRQFIERHQLLLEGQLCVAALSGGADSVAMLLILKQLGYRVEAAHCNFHLRGDESDRDEQFCVALCQRLEVPLHRAHFDTQAYAAAHRVSIELAARQLRYGWFEQLCSDLPDAVLCTAHHRNDNAETLLLNLIRGTGIHGAAGIRAKNGYIRRPLLCLSREEIVDFLRDMGQPYVTDSTNLQEIAARNVVRLRVMPLLEQLNPAAAKNLSDSARRISEAEKVFSAAIEKAMSDVSTRQEGELVVDIQRLEAQVSPEYTLFMLLSAEGFSSQQVADIYAHLHAPSGRQWASETKEVVVFREKLYVTPRPKTTFRPLRLPEEGAYVEPPVRISVSREPVGEDFRVSRAPFEATLDAADVRFPLLLRTVESGDRFVPFGMEGSRLVNDFLADRGLHAARRRRQLVVTDAEGRILWVVGARTDNRFRITNATREALKINVSTVESACNPTA